jgi:hypothetical protein
MIYVYTKSVPVISNNKETHKAKVKPLWAVVALVASAPHFILSGVVVDKEKRTGWISQGKKVVPCRML